MKVYRLTKDMTGEVNYKDGRNRRKSMETIISEVINQIIECNTGTMEYFASEEEAWAAFKAIPTAEASKRNWVVAFLYYYGAAILEESEEFEEEENDERTIEEMFSANCCGEILAINKPEITDELL